MQGVMRKAKSIKPEILSFECVELEPVQDWIPDDPYDVDFWMTFFIGEEGKGGDYFYARVATPNNLHGKNSDKYAIVLTEYSLFSVLDEVNKKLEEIEAEDWAHVADELSKFMKWEYENYKP